MLREGGREREGEGGGREEGKMEGGTKGWSEGQRDVREGRKGRREGGDCNYKHIYSNDSTSKRSVMTHKWPIASNAKPINIHVLYSSCYGNSNDGNERSDVAQGIGLEGSKTSNKVKVVGIVECQTTSDVLHL